MASLESKRIFFRLFLLGSAVLVDSVTTKPGTTAFYPWRTVPTHPHYYRTVTPDPFRERQGRQCRGVGHKPFFKNDLVVGVPWRIYYTWHTDFSNICMDFVMKYSTPLIEQRILNLVGHYVEPHPQWGTSELVMKYQKAKRDVGWLLFTHPDGPEGRFIAVPKTIDKNELSRSLNVHVPPKEFQMKLFEKGRYLLIVDCVDGVSTLAARSKPTPAFKELVAFARTIRIRDGQPACVKRR